MAVIWLKAFLLYSLKLPTTHKYIIFYIKSSPNDVKVKHERDNTNQISIILLIRLSPVATSSLSFGGLFVGLGN